VESMYYGVPVIAFDAAAVADTLNGCGLLVQHKDHAAIAEQIGLVLNDSAQRERIVTQQRQRVAAFDVEHVRPLWRAALQRVLETKL
jgi:L-malate glycosyltransferase